MSPSRHYLSLFEFTGSLAVWHTTLDGDDEPSGTILDVDDVDDVLESAYEWWPLSIVGADPELDLGAALRAAADPLKESAAAENLGELLLPEGLVDRVDLATSSRRPQLVVNPSPSLASLPWEVLTLPGDGRRLVEVFDVRMAVPATVVGAFRPPGREYYSEAVFVVDPVTRLGRVLPTESVSAWERRIGTAPWFPQEFVDREMLKAHLLTQQPRRLTFFGHCLPAAEDASAAGIMLSDHAAVPGATRSVSGGRPLAAHDLLAESAGNGDAGMWSLPPNVGLVACGSGLDQAFPEPLGLVAAVMERGADVVMASRWTLPSDQTTGGATTALGLAVDEALASSDPISHLNEWKRQQLRAWVDAPSLGTSPVLWASIAAYSMPSAS